MGPDGITEGATDDGITEGEIVEGDGVGLLVGFRVGR